MYDHVCQALFEAYSGLEFNTVALYNSRGVGRSTGCPSVWGGRQEVEDLRALCGAIQSMERAPSKIVLVGYSYGSQIASGICDAQHRTGSSSAASGTDFLAAVVAVSPPVGAFASGMLRTKHLWDRFAAANVPKAIAIGDSDQFAPIRSLRRKVEEGKGWGSRADLFVYDGQNHFWLGGAEKMARDVLEWTVKLLNNV